MRLCKWLLATSALVLLGAPSGAIAADLGREGVVVERRVGVARAPRLVPPCREAWHADLLRCQRHLMVDPALVKRQLQVIDVRRKPYPELFSWGY